MRMANDCKNGNGWLMSVFQRFKSLKLWTNVAALEWAFFKKFLLIIWFELITVKPKNNARARSGARIPQENASHHKK